MEQINIKNLPKGTLAGLEKRASKKGFFYLSGKPNIAAMVRDILTRESLKK